MKRRGVGEIFPAGTSLRAMTEWVRGKYSGASSRSWPSIKGISRTRTNGGAFPAMLALMHQSVAGSKHAGRMSALTEGRVIGITGPGGAGKTTLIDELALRYLRERPGDSIAVLAHDPGTPGKGALLGDRAAMVYAHDDRVFMHSLATTARGQGISAQTRDWLQILRGMGFGLVLVESAGIGQQDLPFGRGLVDRTILVLSPEYGGGLQLQKIGMLESADIVVVNKADRAGARTALAEVDRRLRRNGEGQKLFATVANRHGNEGVDELFREVEG
jgi:methylmalonyl-CoA mutase